MKYYIKDQGEKADAAQTLNGSNSLDVVQYAEDAAEYYYHNRDGWESTWPIVFTVIDDRGEEHNVSVTMDFDPTFIGHAVGS